MTKVSESWTNRDIQRDPQGYLAAQAKEREQARAESEKDRERDDLARYTRTFVAEGGDPIDAEAAWRAQRTEQAALSAKQKSEAARQAMRARRMKVV